MIRRLYPIVAHAGRLLPQRCSCVNKLQKCRIASSMIAQSETKPPSNLTRRTFSGTEDVLAVQLMKATSTDRVVDLLQMHHSVMNNQHLMIVLETLCNFKKEHNLRDLSLETPEFRGLCRRLQQRARFFDVDSVLNILKFTSLLGVRADSALMQHYLQMLRHQVNDLTIQQLLYLSFFLDKQISTPLVEALKIALPMVLENQIEMQLDPDNLQELVKLLEFATYRDVRRNVMQKIVDALILSKKPLDALNAQNILWSCLNQHKSELPFSTLFNKALDVCVTQINDIPTSRLMKLSYLFSKKQVCYVDFWDAVCKRAVEESWPLMTIHTIICSLSAMSLVNLHLLDKYAELIEKNAEDVQFNPKLSIHSLVGAFSLPNYKPPNMDSVLKVVLDSTDKIRDLQSRHIELFTRFAINLAVLNCIPTNIYQEICDGRFVELIEAKLRNERMSPAYRANLLRDLLLLHQLAPVLGYRFEFDANLKTEAISVVKASNFQFPLQRALQRALGGHQYLLNGLFTRSGVFIDHLLVMRRGNYPVAFPNGTTEEQDSTINTGTSSDVKWVEDVAIPEDAKKIAVLVQLHTSMTSNVKRITGLAQLPGRILAYEGYHPVAVPLVVWEELPEHERIPYIMKEIKVNADSWEAAEVAP